MDNDQTHDQSDEFFSRKSEQLMLTIKIVADSEVMADTCRFNNFFCKIWHSGTYIGTSY